MTKQWRMLKEVRLISGLIIVLIIAAPWHILMAQAHPDFLDFYFIHEHLTRYLTDEHKRTAPWWFFITVILVGLLPWTGVLPQALNTLKNDKNNSQQNMFIALWILLPLLFFSSSHSKLIAYIFPIFPPLAIIMGRTLADFWEETLPVRALRKAASAAVLVFLGAITSLQILPALPGKIGAKMAMLNDISWPMLLPILLALIMLAYVIISKRPARILIITLAFFGAVTGISVNYIFPAIDHSSIKPLVAKLNAGPNDIVAAYGSYWQDLPVYLNRDVMVAGWTGELSFGVEHYPQTHEWMMSTDTFWQHCAAAKHNVYVFINQATLTNLAMPKSCQLHEIATYGTTTLMEKQHD